MPRPDPAEELLQGSWLRFPDYSLEDGYVFMEGQPEPYQPWRELRQGRAAIGAASGRPADAYAPYLDLAILAGDLPSIGEGHEARLSPRQQRAVLGWYRAHGPLGLLSHTTLLATLYPTWDQPLEEGKLPDGTSGIFTGPFTPVQRTFARTSKGWVTRETWSHEHASDRKKPGAQLSVEVGQPQALVTPLGRWEPTSVSLPEGWGPYFPGVEDKELERYQYPRPNTISFWRRSAEPVERFIEAAHTMANLLHDVSQNTDRRRRAWGREVLGILLMPVGVHPEPGTDRGLGIGFEAPSLLATHAMMILENLMGSCPLRACDWCGKLFVNSKKTYCDDTCSGAFRQRKHKRKMDAQRSTGSAETDAE